MKRAAIASGITIAVFAVGAFIKAFEPGITAIIALAAGGLYVAVSRRPAARS